MVLLQFYFIRNYKLNSIYNNIIMKEYEAKFLNIDITDIKKKTKRERSNEGSRPSQILSADF